MTFNELLHNLERDYGRICFRERLMLRRAYDVQPEVEITTDCKQAYANAEKAMTLRYFHNIEWENIDNAELKKLYIMVGNELEEYSRRKSKCQYQTSL